MCYINGPTKKNCMIISIDVECVCGGGEICQNSTLVHDLKKKQLRKITIERNCFHLIKGKTPSVDILLNDKRMDAFPLRLRTR